MLLMRATTRKHQVREINLVFVVDNEILITLLILLIIRVLHTSISINTSHIVHLNSNHQLL